VVGTEDTLGVGECLLIQRNSLPDAARGQIGIGEVVAGDQRVGVVAVENSLPVSERLLKQGDGVV
jgi:hypothetical protein